MVFHVKERTQTECFLEQGAENIWTQERGINRRMEKMHKMELHKENEKDMRNAYKIFQTESSK